MQQTATGRLIPKRAWRGLGPALWLLVLALLVAPLYWPAEIGGTSATLSPGDKESGAKAPESVPDQLLIGFAEGVDAAEREAVVAGRGARTLQRLDSINALLVALPNSKDVSIEATGFRTEATS